MINHLIVFIFLSSIFTASAAKKISIFVSIPPQKYIVEQIAGDVASVKSLLNENDNPHSFVVRPSVIKMLAGSDAYLQVGIPFETTILTKLIGSGMKISFYRQDKGIKRRHIKTAHKCSTGCVHDVAEADPHFWISSTNVIKMAENCCEVLSQLKPELKASFESNLSKFKKSALTVDEKLKKELLVHKGKGFYVYHPAFGYFADSYSLVQNAVESEGKKPSPRQLNKLISNAKMAGIKTIIVQNQFDRHAAEKLANILGGNVIEVNPMQENVLKLLESLGEAIKTGFGN